MSSHRQPDYNRSEQHRSSHSNKSKGKSRREHSDSDTETIDPSMYSRSSVQSPTSGSSKRHGSSSKSKSSKSDDWSEVTDPEERRRIQNRIAQRKFRDKAKEQKEKSERDSRNAQYAGGSYRVPETGEMDYGADDASGLPWGGVNMGYVVGHGHGHGASGSGSHKRGGSGSQRASDHAAYRSSQYLSPMGYSSGGSAYQQYETADGHSWDGQDGGEDQMYYDTSPYYYDYDGSANH